MKTETHIDSAGRIVIPKALRKRYGLETGQKIRFIMGSEGITIVPEHRAKRFYRRGPLLCIDTGTGPAPLDVFDVDRLRSDHLDGKTDEDWR